MSLFVCIKQFNARLGDELSLKVGDKVEVLADDSEYNDGWYMGKNLLTGDVGLYPKLFTQAVTAADPVALVLAKLAEAKLEKTPSPDEFIDVPFEQETMSPNGIVLKNGTRPNVSAKQLRGAAATSKLERSPQATTIFGTPPLATLSPTPLSPLIDSTNGIPETTTPSSLAILQAAKDSIDSSPTTEVVPKNDSSNNDVGTWLPEEVTNYFDKVLHFDPEIAGKFTRHEITGQILLELDLSHLKELDIDLFGIRFQVYKEIEKLKQPLAVVRKALLLRNSSLRVRQKDLKLTITGDPKSPSRTASPPPVLSIDTKMAVASSRSASTEKVLTPVTAEGPNIYTTPKQRTSSVSRLAHHSRPNGQAYPHLYKPQVVAPPQPLGSIRSQSSGLPSPNIGPGRASPRVTSPYQASPVGYQASSDPAPPVILGGLASLPDIYAASKPAPHPIGENGWRPASLIYDTSPANSQTFQRHMLVRLQMLERSTLTDNSVSLNNDAAHALSTSSSQSQPTIHPPHSQSTKPRMLLTQRPYSTMEPVNRAVSMFSFALEEGLPRLPKLAANLNAVSAAQAASHSLVQRVSPPTVERLQTPEIKGDRSRDPDAPTPPPKDRSLVYRRREKKQDERLVSNGTTSTTVRHLVYQDVPRAEFVENEPEQPKLETIKATAEAPKKKGPTKLTSPVKVKRSLSLFSPKQRKLQLIDSLPEVVTAASADEELPVQPPPAMADQRLLLAPSVVTSTTSTTNEGKAPLRLKTLRTTSTQNFRQLAVGKKQKTSAFQEGIQEVIPEELAKTAAFSGWMLKRLGNTLLWRLRFFVLHGTRLLYFTSLKDRREKGLIDITAHRVMPLTQDKVKTGEDNNDKYIALYAALTGSGRYCFKLLPPAPGYRKGLTFTQPKVHYFAVDTADEMRGWLKALMAATIDIDDLVPVVLLCVTPTVSLVKAQELLAKAREETRLRDEQLRAQGINGIEEETNDDDEDEDLSSPTDYTQFLHDHSFDIPGLPLNDSQDDTTTSSVGAGLLSVGGLISRSNLGAPRESLGRLPLTPLVLAPGGGFALPYMLAGGMALPRLGGLMSPQDGPTDYFPERHLLVATVLTSDTNNHGLVTATPKLALLATVNRAPSSGLKVLGYASDSAGNITFHLKNKK